MTRLLFAVPNFSGRLGKATLNIGKRLKAEGRRKGVWDILYPVARCGYNALWIEAIRTTCLKSKPPSAMTCARQAAALSWRARKTRSHWRSRSHR